MTTTDHGITIDTADHRRLDYLTDRRHPTMHREAATTRQETNR